MGCGKASGDFNLFVSTASCGIAFLAQCASVLSHANVDNDHLARNPLTRPAPAEESAGCGPPSPPRGRGAGFHFHA